VFKKRNSREGGAGIASCRSPSFGVPIVVWAGDDRATVGRKFNLKSYISRNSVSNVQKCQHEEVVRRPDDKFLCATHLALESKRTHSSQILGVDWGKGG